MEISILTNTNNEILKEIYDKHKYFNINLRNDYTRRYNEVIEC